MGVAIMAIPYTGFLLLLAVSHGLVTAKYTRSRNKIRFVVTSCIYILLPTNMASPALNRVQPTSLAPPATASVNQGVAISAGVCVYQGTELHETRRKRERECVCV
jgi:hypothetical protein